MRRITICVLAALLLALPGLAFADPANNWTNCSSSTSSWATTTVSARVGSSGMVCYEIDETLTVATGDTSFACTGRKCKFECNLDVQSTTTGDARLTVYSCPNAFTPSEETCGESAKAFGQDDSIALTRGTYWVDLTTVVTGGEDLVCGLIGYE